MSDTKLMGANAAVAKMLSTPDGAAKIDAAFAELERQRTAAVARDAAISAAVSSMADGGFASVDGVYKEALERFAAAERWAEVAKRAGA